MLFEIIIYENEAEVFGSYDLAVASPGIPPHSSLYQSALRCSRELISEPELAWRMSPERWIGITGTNGKTTTTTLVAHLLEQAGIPARKVGNIGNPCIEAVTQRAPDEYLVTELSSYQLFSMSRFAPDVAILLGITPDHLSWHGTYEDYEQAKLKILTNMDEQSLAVIDATNDPARAALSAARATGLHVIGVGSSKGLYSNIGTLEGLYSSMLTFSGAQNAAYVASDSHALTVVLDGICHTLCHAADLKIRGAHNLTNALAAASAVLHLGVGSESVSAGLASFTAPEHRFEPCGEVGGVRFYNDSKATNTDATIKAIESFGDAEGRRVIALLGGRDKGTDLTGLVTTCSRNCHTVICFGEAAERFYNAFKACDSFKTLRVAGFNEACTTALASSTSGDIILLSPACASFDEFSCFEARGMAFKAFVESLRTSAPENPVIDATSVDMVSMKQMAKKP